MKPRDFLWLTLRQPTASEQVSRLGGAEVAKVLRAPRRVEAVLLEPPAERSDVPARDYHEIGQPIEASADVAADVIHQLLTPELNRVMGTGGKACLTRWAVRISYFSDADRVDLYLCFQCTELLVDHNGSEAGRIDIFFISDQLLRDALKLFPDDAGLNQLARHRLE